jgi:hypothetical protein
MTTRSRFTIAWSTAVVLAAACSKSEQPAKDTTTRAAAAAPTPAPPAAFSFADAAGKWQVRAVPVSGDTTSTNYVLTATADTTGWMITFPSGVKVPLHVMASGDSVIVKTGKFPSQRRKNVTVSTEGGFRIQNGKLVGTSVAHYVNAGPDSVLQLKTEGTKMP